MAGFNTLIAELRKTEGDLEQQLKSVRSARIALESGTGGASTGKRRQRRGNMSAAARKAVSQRMKKYWAERRKKSAAKS
jgi:hypothetical protein